MEGDKMVLIAYHMLERSIGAYLEWLANEVIMTANKTWLKDLLLVMFFANKKENNKSYCLSYPLESGNYSLESGKSCEYIVYSGFILPLLQVQLEE